MYMLMFCLFVDLLYTCWCVYIHMFRVTDNEACLLYEYLFVCCIHVGVLCTC